MENCSLTHASMLNCYTIFLKQIIPWNGVLGHLCAHIYRLNWVRKTSYRMVRWMWWHCHLDTGFVIRDLGVWQRARYLSGFPLYEWAGKKPFVSLKPERLKLRVVVAQYNLNWVKIEILVCDIYCFFRYSSTVRRISASRVQYGQCSYIETWGFLEGLWNNYN